MATTEIPVTVAKNTAVSFSSLVINGDVIYFKEQNALVLIDDETGGPERLSINLASYGLNPRPGHVFIKDWSEGAGVAVSLAEAGVVEIIGSQTVGPFASTAYEARVIL